MAGTRDSIARWRRIKHLAMVLCVLSVVLLALSCGVQCRITLQRDARTLVSGAGVERWTIPHSLRSFLAPSVPDVRFRLAYTPPDWLPSWGVTDPPEEQRWAFVPLWPVPVAFGGLAWYANTRIKRQRQGACIKCGYDTRGFAAGAVCPECGTTCSV